MAQSFDAQKLEQRVESIGKNYLEYKIKYDGNVSPEEKEYQNIKIDIAKNNKQDIESHGIVKYNNNAQYQLMNEDDSQQIIQEDVRDSTE